MARLGALLVLAVTCYGCALTRLDLDGGAHVTELALPDASTFALVIDDVRPLALALLYDDGFEEHAPPDLVSWSVSDPRVAAIDGNRQLRARGIGTAVLAAHYGDRSATVTVSVTDLPQQLELMASTRSCAVGQQISYRLLLRYQHGATEDVTARATWQSSQPAIASVAAGVVVGRAAGDTVIEAHLGTLTTSANTHVSAAIAPPVARSSAGRLDAAPPAPNLACPHASQRGANPLAGPSAAEAAC